MQPSEQAHAYALFNRLKTSGQTNAELLTAALLHDVGKVLYPMSTFQRVLVVMGKRFCREAAQRWAEGAPRGLRLPFVVSARHAGWGADLASKAGATNLTVELIRRHDEVRLSNPDSHTERMLAALQAADDEN